MSETVGYKSFEIQFSILDTYNIEIVMSVNQKQYVAETEVQAALYTRPQERRAIPNPSNYGIIRGYWMPTLRPDLLGTLRSVGLTLVLQFIADEREQAEDKALAISLDLSGLISLHSGSPLSLPILKRLAHIGPNGGVLQQNVYYYLSKSDRLPRISMDTDELNKLFDWNARLDRDAAYRCTLGTRWYGMAVGAADALDSYLAVWIGLECVGPLIDKRFHPNGPKVSCKTCGNPSGIDRDRKMAGIEHIVQLVAPELLTSYSVYGLADVRNEIAHGRAPYQQLHETASELLPDMLLSLGVALLTAMKPDNVVVGSGRAALPREYEFRPDARATMDSNAELVKHAPYFGGWIAVERKFIEERSRCESNGEYIWGANKVSILWEYTAHHPTLKVTQEYVDFERRGHSFTRTAVKSGGTIIPPAPTAPWRDIKISTAWERYRKNAEDERSLD